MMRRDLSPRSTKPGSPKTGFLITTRKLFLGTPTVALFTGLTVLVLLALLEYRVPNSVDIALLYAVPIFFVTWFHSRFAGILASLTGTAVWLTDERVFSADFAIHPQLYLWNAAIRLGAFLLLVLLLSKIKALLLQEKRASALKSQLIHVVSHEFNNALMSSYASLHLLRETEPEPASGSRVRYYEMLEATNQKLKIYVKNILNEARMESGRFKLERRDIALRDIAEEAAACMSELVKLRGLTLVREYPSSLVFASVDKEVLALVISNLLGNAVKYTPQSGRITLRIALCDGAADKVKVEVEDTGPGISADDIRRVTAGFHRTAEGHKPEGFGLGLRISNELLGFHGSRLEITSEKGRGSRFSFRLPVVPKTAA